MRCARVRPAASRLCLADPVGCRLALEGRLSSGESLGEALRQRSGQGGLPPCSEGPCSTDAVSQLPADCITPGSVRSRGSASSPHASGTPLSAEYAQALHRNSHRLLDAVASSASSGTGGSSENPVPLPEQETLMLPLKSEAAASPAECVRAAAEAAAAAREQPPCAADASKGRRLSPWPTDAPAGDVSTSCCSVSGLQSATSMALAADESVNGAVVDATDPCTCPPFAVKATCGKRSIMEDTYALCPNICELPMPHMAAGIADKLPQRIAVQLANREPSADEPAGPAAANNGLGARDGNGNGSGSTVNSSADGAALEKLHFFGVYDGHGGIQASQHCAARLHHHLSASLRDMAASVAAQLTATSAGNAVSMEVQDGAWRPPVVPEVSAGGRWQGSSSSNAVPSLPGDSAGQAVGSAAYEHAFWGAWELLHMLLRLL